MRSLYQVRVQSPTGPASRSYLIRVTRLFQQQDEKTQIPRCLPSHTWSYAFFILSTECVRTSHEVSSDFKVSAVVSSRARVLFHGPLMAALRFSGVLRNAFCLRYHCWLPYAWGGWSWPGRVTLRWPWAESSLATEFSRHSSGSQRKDPSH